MKNSESNRLGVAEAIVAFDHMKGFCRGNRPTIRPLVGAPYKDRPNQPGPQATDDRAPDAMLPP